MGSRFSSNTTQNPNNDNSNPINDNAYDTSKQSHVYMKDKFQLEFLDCNCCCDTTKKVANCDFQGVNVLRDLYELVETPEYKVNCRCLCGDDIGNKKQTIKFGITSYPSMHTPHIKHNLSQPTSSDSSAKT